MLKRFTCVTKFLPKLITCDRLSAYSRLSRPPCQVDVRPFSQVSCKGVEEEKDMHENAIATLRNKIFPDPCKDASLYCLYRVAGFCNGIICFSFGEYFCGEIYIWNPSLNQIRHLADDDDGDAADPDLIGFGYDSKNQEHKFVRIHSGLSCKVEVYSLEKDLWKTFNHDGPAVGRGSLHEYHMNPVEFNGSLNWISTRLCVCTFGLSDEKFSVFPIPDHDVDDIRDVSLGVVNGCLSILITHNNDAILFTPSETVIWSMMDKNNNGDYSWTKTYEFPDNLCGRIEYNSGLTANGKIDTYDLEKGIWVESSKIVWYDFLRDNYYRAGDLFTEFLETLKSDKGAEEEKDMHESMIDTLKNESFSNLLSLGTSISRVSGIRSGIICFSLGWGKSKVYIWNPYLNQIHNLTDDEFCAYNFLGFGYDSKNKLHKFVRIHSGVSAKVEVYCLEKDSWKSFDHDIPPSCDRLCPWSHSKPLEYNGSLYWISKALRLCTFGLSDEKFTECLLPKGDFDLGDLSLGVVKGCISVLTHEFHRDVKQTVSVVWSMMDANKNGDCSWTKTFEFPDRLGYKIGCDAQFTAKGKILSENGLYDLETKVLEQYSGRNKYDFLKGSCNKHFIEYLASFY